jgi:hypothetical protein
VRGAQIATLQEKARASVGLRDVAALGTEIRVLARRILSLNEEIAQAEETIAAEFAALGYTPEQFPAGGPVALATILAEVGDIRRFPRRSASWHTSAGARGTDRAGNTSRPIRTSPKRAIAMCAK